MWLLSAHVNGKREEEKKNLHHGTAKTLGSRRRPWDERAQFFDSVVIFPMSRLKCSLCASACARVKLLRGFWARGRVRGDRSVFVTSHRPVHSSRALMFQPGSSFCISVQERYFLFDGFACLLLITLIIKVLLLEFEQVFLCELHTPPPLFPRVQRTAFTATTASVETVSK